MHSAMVGKLTHLNGKHPFLKELNTLVFYKSKCLFFRLTTFLALHPD